MRRLSFFFLLAFLLSTCAPAEPVSDQSVVTVYATPSAGPWLSELYDCANAASVVLNLTPDAPQILLRVGEPAGLSTPSFQIDTEDILVVVHRLSPLQTLTLQQARDLFAGRGDPSIQVWIYDGATDVESVFEKTIMGGQSVVSSARLASDPQQMSDLLNADPTVVGVLPRHWKMGDTREIFVISSVPVLAITPTEPQGATRNLLACLQT